ncbi:MAG: MBL fold metallo-hydrolase [Candidatus Pacebacteria bacterium]|nr:MBL fold metallo-hydrolase [Candidatus Paceibacterota bacterium]
MSQGRAVLWGALALLIPLTAFTLFFVFKERPYVLTVSFLDVGQGDAIYIEGPTGIDVLVDGGRGRAVLRTLPKEMGFFDRSLDMVVATHPDADHIEGLVDVFKRYRVLRYMEPGVENDTGVTHALLEAVGKEKDVEHTLARRGQRILLGAGAYADVLYPDREVTHSETNDASVVLHVVYGETEFFLSGDAPVSVEKYVVYLEGERLESDVLKAGHHGSHTSTSDELLAVAKPKMVVISAGKDNSYGHPHKEVVEKIQNTGATMLETSKEGTITLVSDGKTVVEK